ncbi:hypothetical protein FQR65_LT09849 [Abscondita terminalis]|nr:hypothetical protein FQR65_LT09849 [Abscondita terminalis]
MQFQILQTACAIYLLIIKSSFTVKVPTEDFDLEEFLKQHEPKNKQHGLTSSSKVFKQGKPTTVSTPEECDRLCYVRQTPKICYYRFVIEHYTTVSGACDLCSRNATNNCQCILGDGVERTIIAVNRQLPGPDIRLCKDDYAIIDVHNGVDGGEVAIHWHGILQHHSQYYDGVPFITQCPIHKGTVFRYKWKAENPGTHFWHSHTGFQKIDGVAGSIIVRESNDIHQRLYDYDDRVLIINDWFHTLANERFPGRRFTLVGQDPDNILINGKGQFIDPVTKISTNTPLEMFEVESDKRYRFRVINAGATTCPVHLIIEGHKMQIIAADGEPVKPVIADSLMLTSAERYDFVLYANQPIGAYWIQVKGIGLCQNTQVYQLAILKYANGPDVPFSAPPSYNGLPTGIIMNLLDTDLAVPGQPAIILQDLESAYPLPPNLLKEKPDVKLFLPFRFANLPKEEVFKPNTYHKFLLVQGGFYLAGLIDGISNVQPTAPLISQYHDNNPKEFCDGDDKSDKCGLECLCTHVVGIPLNAVVEVCIVDEVQIPQMYHPFHLHGHTFYVMEMRNLPNVSDSINLEKAIADDMERSLRTRTKRPPGKDTLPVPNNGYACFRFIADNPGFWFFHCHFLYHLTIGMTLTFKVGDISDLPPIPKGFPKCDNFPPDLS